MTSRDILIMKDGYPDFLVPGLVNRVTNLEALPVHKQKRIFSSIVLQWPGSDSWRENQPPHYVANSMSTHQVLFSLTSLSSFLSVSFNQHLENCAQVEGNSTWF